MLFVWHAALQKLASMDSTATNSSNLNSAATKDTGSMLMTLVCCYRLLLCPYELYRTNLTCNQ